MHKLLKNHRVYNILICLGLTAALVALVLFPSEAVAAAGEGLSLCTRVIIPSLFPFFVLSNLVVSLGLAQRLGRLLEPIMRPLFNVNGACSAAFVLGFIGGYPVGAKTALSLYRQGTASKSETERLLSFCNNSGPAFILGVVGAGIFSSSLVGLLLYLAHALASVCVGIIFRRWGTKGVRPEKHSAPPAMPMPRFAPAFTEAVSSAFSAVLGICGFVIFFTVIIKMLFLSGIIPALAACIGLIFSPLGLDPAWAERLLTGLIELSSGVSTLQGAAISSSLAMAAFMLGWAGLSVHCQVLSFIGDSGLSVKTYILGKLLHGLLSALFVGLVSRFLTLEAPVAAYLVEQVDGITGVGFSTILAVSLFSCLLLLCLFLLAGRRRRGRS